MCVCVCMYMYVCVYIYIYIYIYIYTHTHTHTHTHIYIYIYTYQIEFIVSQQDVSRGIPKRGGQVANRGDCTLFRLYTVRMKLKNVGLLTILGIHLHGYLLCDFIHLPILAVYLLQINFQ